MNSIILRLLILVSAPFSMQAMEREMAKVSATRTVPVTADQAFPFYPYHLFLGGEDQNTRDFQCASVINVLCGSFSALDWNLAMDIVQWVHTHKNMLKADPKAVREAFLTRALVTIYNKDRSRSITLDPTIIQNIPGIEKFRDKDQPNTFIFPQIGISSLLLFKMLLCAQYNYLSKPKKENQLMRILGIGRFCQQ